VVTGKLDVIEAAAHLPEETEDPELMDEGLEEKAIEEVTGEDNLGDYEKVDAD
jgi:hypothetical protein